MSYKESIITNIAFRIGELYAGGAIKLDEKYTLNSLTEDILNLSNLFFEKYPEEFFKAGELDFSEEIYEFTRKGFHISPEHEQIPGTEIEDMPMEAEIYLLSGGGTRRLFHSGSYLECMQICEAMDWRFFDENEFEWELDLENLRENTVENDMYVQRRHLEKLVGEPVTLEEYKILRALCDMDFTNLDHETAAEPFMKSFRQNLVNLRTGADELEYVTPCVKVEWVNCDEGLWGDYNENNPEDINLLRFDVSVLMNGEWVEKEDASYCTRFPADTSIEDKIEALRCIGKEYHDALEDDLEVSVKKLGERLSWISPETLPSKTVVKQSLEQQIQSANQRISTSQLNAESEIIR